MERILAVLGGLMVLGALLATASRKAEAYGPHSTAAVAIRDFSVTIDSRNETFDYDSRNVHQVALKRLTRYTEQVQNYFASEKPVVAFVYPVIKNRNCTALRTMNLKPIAVQAGEVHDDVRTVVISGINGTFASGARRSVVFRADSWVTQEGVAILPTGKVGSELAICLQFADDIPVYTKNTPLSVVFHSTGPVFFGRTLMAYIRPF